MFALGISYSAFVSLLIPPFVTEAGGDASTAGIVMAIIALGALGGPPIGSFADRYSAHRIVMVGGIAGMALSFVAYALSADSSALYALDAILMGISVAAVSATAPVFIVGARLDQKTEAKQMTTLQLMMPTGQLVGGLILAGITGWSFSNRFWLGAGIVAVSFVVVWLTTANVSRRLKHAVAQDADSAPDGGRKKIGLKKVLFSTFGIYFAVLVFTSIANNGVNAHAERVWHRCEDNLGIDLSGWTSQHRSLLSSRSMDGPKGSVPSIHGRHRRQDDRRTRHGSRWSDDGQQGIARCGVHAADVSDRAVRATHSARLGCAFRNVPCRTGKWLGHRRKRDRQLRRKPPWRIPRRRFRLQRGQLDGSGGRCRRRPDPLHVAQTGREAHA